MCKVFEVSRSGYYVWKKRQQKEAKDQWLVDLITACQQQSRQTYGIRRVRRWIQRQNGKSVNLKAILRVMRKLNLMSVIRRRRPYTRYQQAIHKLIAEVQTATSSLAEEDQQTVSECLEVIETEAVAEKPKKGMIKTALSALQTVKGVAEFGAAVATLVEFISPLL